MDKFVQIDHQFMNMAPKLGASAFMVYTFLKMYMNQNTKECFPSHDSLAQKTGYNKRQVMRAIKVLELNGLIHVTRSKKQVNRYYLRNKTFWGQDIYSLGKGIIMRCPECDLPVVKDKATRNFICPKCLMDVGGYCKDILSFHYPDVTDPDIYRTKGEKAHAYSIPLTESYYTDQLEKERTLYMSGKDTPHIYYPNKKEVVEDLVVDEPPFYCPNCFLVMTGMDKREVDCPWCQEKVMYKPLNVPNALSSVGERGRCRT